MILRFALAALLAQAASVEPPPPSAAAPPVTGPSQTVSGVTVTARRPTHVAGVTVVATNWCPDPDPRRYPAAADPKVIDSWPRPGGAPPPGVTLVRVTFDQPMSCYSEVSEDGGEADPCEPQGTWSLPGRTSFILQCRLEPNTRYTFAFRKTDGEGFVGLSGRRAEPFVLAFQTTGGPPVASATAALALDPGAPDAGRVSAYVTCVDETASARGGDCSHRRFTKPPG